MDAGVPQVNDIELAAETADEKRKRLSQWLSPDYVAQAMWARARTHNPKRVLEPSAGSGQLILPIDDGVEVHACEVDPDLIASHLEQLDPPLAAFYEGDFLRLDFSTMQRVGNPHLFDVAIMNPPFENNQDVRHVIKAFELSTVVIACVRVQFMHRRFAYEQLWSRRDVCLSWRDDLIPRPRFGGDYTPMDEYVLIELRHGEQTPTIEYARLLSPKLLAREV